MARWVQYDERWIDLERIAAEFPAEMRSAAPSPAYGSDDDKVEESESEALLAARSLRSWIRCGWRWHGCQWARPPHQSVCVRCGRDLP